MIRSFQSIHRRTASFLSRGTSSIRLAACDTTEIPLPLPRKIATTASQSRQSSSSVSTTAGTMTRPSTMPHMGNHTPTKTVLVLGASYGGHKAVQSLVGVLPSSWRVAVLERNTHFNHLYAFPRMSIVSGHEHKIFVPYTKVFEPLEVTPTATNNVLLHGSLTSLSHSQGSDGQPALGRGVATYTPLSGSGETAPSSSSSSSPRSIHFDYLVYALGSQLPPPINIWSTASGKESITSGPQVQDAQEEKNAAQAYEENVTISQTRGSKAAGITWLKETQERIRKAESILVIGAGALGVQYASDIAWTYGTATSPPRWAGHGSVLPKPKRVTLLSSSPQILPRFQPWMHEEGVRSLEALGIEVITGARADMNTLGDSASGERRTIKTLDGQQIEADLVLFCTGQRPNTGYLETAFGDVISKQSGMANVTPYLQLVHPNSSQQTDTNHIFVIGDAADAFGAINAGHKAGEQADTAARNIARLVALEEERGKTEQAEDIPEWIQSPLEEYIQTPRRIKVSVGLDKAIIENTGKHRIATDAKEDLNAANLWLKRGLDISDMNV